MCTLLPSTLKPTLAPMSTNPAPAPARPFDPAGTYTLALRLVVGWTYFSAFWRRTALANKLDWDAEGYIGEKFNHFLPHALGIKPLIEYLVSNPDALWWSMLAFTMIEGIVGLLLMLGLFTRAMSVAVFGLAMGILLGSGWIGTTCLDEWQIGILGLAAGFTLFLSGGGIHSLDRLLAKRGAAITRKAWFPWVASGHLDVFSGRLFILAPAGAGIILLLSLFTNQVFHGGVWGKLHNKSVKPRVEITDAALGTGGLRFTVQRVEGADVYGSFLIGLDVLDAGGNKVLALTGEDLARFPQERIQNAYVAKVKPGKHSMILPLGAKADLFVQADTLSRLPTGAYRLRLTDISGAVWEAPIAH